MPPTKKTYVYTGNRNPGDHSVGISYTGPSEGDKPQGVAPSAGAQPIVAIGDTIELTDSEHLRLSAYFVLDACEAEAAPTADKATSDASDTLTAGKSDSQATAKK